MRNKMTLVISFCVIIGALIFNFGCNGTQGGETSFGSVSIPTILPPGSTPPPPAGPPGTSTGLLDDAQFFYVGLDTTKDPDIIAHVHATTGFGDSCGIDKSTPTNTDMTCLIEMPEADIYAKNIELVHNIPADMCRYLVRYPYYFYNYEVGKGPSSIIINTNIARNASNDITGVTYDCTVDGTPDANCDDPASTLLELKNLQLTQTSSSFKCVYDHSDTAGKPNCCVGDYTVTRNTIDPLGNTTSSQNLSWGVTGAFPNDCYAGSGMVDPLKSADGSDTATNGDGLLEFTQNGVKAKHKITAPGGFNVIPTASKVNFFVANYYGDAANHLHTGFVSASTSSAPYFIAPIDDRSGSSIASTNDAYTYICYDEGYEALHRINVFIRDWDTYADFVNYISSNGATVVPDRAAADVEGPNCVGILGGCSDLGDLDDFLTKVVPGAPTSYDMSTVNNRTNYFPKAKYTK